MEKPSISKIEGHHVPPEAKRRALTSNVSNDGERAVDKVFRIRLIWDNIADHLTPYDLMNCRLVCSSWESFFSSILLETDLLVVSFKYDIMKTRYRHNKAAAAGQSDSYFNSHRNLREVQKKESYTLNALISCLTNSFISNTTFPSSGFRFRDGDYQDIELQTLLSLHGSIIKTLSVKWGHPDEIVCPVMDTDLVWKLLSSQAPNLDTLELGHFTPTPQNKKGIGTTTSENFPGLKKIIFPKRGPRPITDSGYKWFVHKLVCSCPNLQFVENFNVDHIEAFLTANKIGIVKEFKLMSAVDGQGAASGLLKFAEVRPQLRRLTCVHSQHASSSVGLSQTIDNYVQAINLIFESSKDTLQILEFEPLGFLQHRIVWPIFKNMKKIIINMPCKKISLEQQGDQDVAHQKYEAFSRKICLQNHFPNVHTLTLQRTDEDPNCSMVPWEAIFPASGSYVRGQLGSVLQVVFNCFDLTEGEWCSLQCHRAMKNLLPNLRKIVLTLVYPQWCTLLEQFINNLASVHGANLQEIVIIQCEDDDLEYELIEREMFLVRNLNTGQTTEPFLAIKGMKELKRLKIIVDNKNMNPEAGCALLHLLKEQTMIQIIEALPGLKMTLAYDQFCRSSAVIQDKLRPLQSYANVIHEKYTPEK